MRPCAMPRCKVPDKRDFMDIHPERSNEDFFRNYDPMVGVGTAAILAAFIILITIKTFIKWITRQIQIFRYKHCSYLDTDLEQHCSQKQQQQQQQQQQSTNGSPSTKNSATITSQDGGIASTGTTTTTTTIALNIPPSAMITGNGHVTVVT